MPERFIELLPFLLVTNGKVQLNTSRIIEAVLIAVIGGAFAGYLAVQKMDVKMQEMEKQVLEMKQDMKRFYTDFYIPRGK